MNDTRKNRLLRRLQWAVADLSYGMTNFRHPLRVKGLIEVKNARRIADVGATPLECTELYNAVAACDKIPGDMAEAGVYRGGTAAVMLPPLRKSGCTCSIPFKGCRMRRVASLSANGRDRLMTYSVTYHAGRVGSNCIPDCFRPMDLGAMRFSFVHLDLDLYDSTLAALEWFWPRIARGGILLSHDYPLAAGVVRAVHEFFDKRSDPFIPLSGNQCLAVKPSD